jgi:hypothetical protein
MAIFCTHIVKYSIYAGIYLKIKINLSTFLSIRLAKYRFTDLLLHAKLKKYYSNIGRRFCYYVFSLY